MPHGNKEGIASRTRAKTSTVGGGISKPQRNIGQKLRAKSSKADSVKDMLKRKREARAFNAESSLSLDSTGVCRINTGRMDPRSQYEIYNYAFLVNNYLKKQRGKRVKIKSTKAQRSDQASFCNAVRQENKELFDELNQGKQRNHKLFSVVAHVPDECIQVRRFGESHNQTTSRGTGGIGKAPGWMPMTNQANGLVAKIGNQTLNSTGQQEGPYLSSIEVDGEEPTRLLPIPVVTQALGHDPYAMPDDEESSEGSSEESSEEGSED